MKLLNVSIIIWVLLVLFSPLRPDPLAQGINESQTIWYSVQKIMMFIPYLALSVLMLNIKFKWIKESWFVNTLPIILFIATCLEAYSCLVNNINGIGSWLTTGIAYIIVLYVARNKKPYSDGLMYGAVSAMGAMFIWEAIYQVIVHTKSGWNIGDNLTFFYSAIVSIPFLIILFKRKVRFNRISSALIVIFTASFIVWAISGFWTYIYYDGSSWVTETYSYWSYFITRINKVALCALFATMTYPPFNEESNKLVIK